MARTVRNGKLDSRSARAKLPPRREPHRTILVQGLALGYRRGAAGGSWVGRWRDPDRKHRHATFGPADDALDADGDRVLSFAQAQERCRDWFAKASKPAPEEPEAPAVVTVANAAALYLAWFAVHKKGHAGTARVVRCCVLPALGDRPVAGLTTKDVRSWHEALASGPRGTRRKTPAPPAPVQATAGATPARATRQRKSTANRKLTVLKALLNHAFNEGHVASDVAWRRVKPFSGADAARLRYLTRDECVRLLGACEGAFKTLVRAALETGCRYGELANAEVGDFDPAARTLAVRENKADKPRHMPLDRGAANFLAGVAAGRAKRERLLARDDGKPWGKSHQQRPLAAACERAGLDEPMTFHGLRHTWASQRIMAGLPLQMAAKVLGRADTRMVEKHYGHLSQDHVREQALRTALSFDSLLADAGNALAG